MKKMIFLLVAFLVLGCATSEQKADRLALKNEIILSAYQVKVVSPGASDWCEAEAKCKYVRNLLCGADSKEQCTKYLQTDAVKLGGDTVVVQSFQKYVGQRGKLYAYAQVYRCSGKFKELGARFQSSHPSRLQKVKYLSNEYARQCGSVKNCKALEPFECHNFDWYPARRCLGTLSQRYTDADEVNVLVFKEEKFTELEDNGKYKKGDYVVKGATYRCDTK
ncbi:MAG: hypothetical protein PVG20_01435 [Thioalkalispiraceae bacterium]|jgi:hypothetical protein